MYMAFTFKTFSLLKRGFVNNLIVANFAAREEVKVPAVMK